MTTSQKITTAFILVMAIMGTLAYVSYSGLTESGAGYRESARVAFLDTATSEALRAVNNSAYFSVLFMRTGEPENIKNAHAQMKRAIDLLVTLEEQSTLQATKAEAQAILKNLRAYDESFYNLEKFRISSITTFEKNLTPAFNALVLALEVFNDAAEQVGTVPALAAMGRLWPILSASEVSLTRYIETEAEVDGDASAAGLVALQEMMEPLEAVITTPRGYEIFADLTKAFQAYTNAFAEIRPMVRASRGASEAGTALLMTLRRDANAFKTTVEEINTRTAADFVSDSDATMTQSLMLTAFGLLFSAICALFILISMNNTFKKLSAFFASIAAGDFDAQSGITEKGAIGTMVTDMQAIPRVLNAIIDGSDTLATTIMHGSFRERFDTSEFKGSFATIGTRINNLANAYTAVIDLMPAPMMACSEDNTIMFLNQAAQTTLGGNKRGQKCSANFNAKECTSSGCFGATCLRNNSMYSGETDITLNGKLMNVNIMATPLRDANGKSIGYIEIITDLTALKSQQHLILKTAAEASDIADRVAAASEQVSVQIEQISRGTEQQMRQVETTSSAMSEMNSTVLEVARNAGQASSQTDETRQKADNGALLVNKVVGAINQVNSVATTLQSNMQELGVQAENIGSVMGVISDIADQTNLLALNAAIEAARAGDAGRGFAVVADEVRKLAEKTMEATHEVGQSISAIQNSARINMEEMGRAVTSVTEATDLANSSGQALTEIVDLTSSNSTLVASIATAAEEQSSTSEEINRSLEDINQIVTEITGNMEQSTSAVRELSSMAQALRTLMEKLR